MIDISDNDKHSSPKEEFSSNNKSKIIVINTVDQTDDSIIKQLKEFHECDIIIITDKEFKNKETKSRNENSIKSNVNQGIENFEYAPKSNYKKKKKNIRKKN